MRWGSACPPEGGFWLPGPAVSFQPRQVNIAFGTGQHFCAGHAFSRALISRLSAAERPVMPRYGCRRTVVTHRITAQRIS
jgi:hypothetical protein